VRENLRTWFVVASHYVVRKSGKRSLCAAHPRQVSGRTALGWVSP